ncbi:type VI secretion system baseplate subunit TssE [Variovorax paradoxus]|uniref:Type VI secretion system lysozyme-related protein n=1 Tax=Variovorax paradoxus (strain EPS) TaxID=595537 RepID=E6UZB5_VARPE|nr:type VI secretion system baseplate subunit TssE [Variovorax paradoxus]ADU36628.1 type VI secretion system lysozyme-related protein [Variovorax paradoxus EPS]
MRPAEQSSPFTGSHPAHPGARSLRPADAPAAHPNAQLLPTLFDRLRDEAPSRTSELPSEYAVTPAQMRDIVQRDLAYLLNTTNAEDLIDRSRHAEAASSTINFGVPPLAGSYLSERRWADIERIIRRAIQDYEPRLIPETVTVVPLMKEGGAAGEYNVLLFEIRALIHLRPYPLAFTVQSAVDLETNRMRVISSAR